MNGKNDWDEIVEDAKRLFHSVSKGIKNAIENYKKPTESKPDLTEKPVDTVSPVKKNTSPVPPEVAPPPVVPTPKDESKMEPPISNTTLPPSAESEQIKKDSDKK